MVRPAYPARAKQVMVARTICARRRGATPTLGLMPQGLRGFYWSVNRFNYAGSRLPGGFLGGAEGRVVVGLLGDVLHVLGVGDLAVLAHHEHRAGARTGARPV